MKTAPKNTTYCSTTIQNEFIDVICTLIGKHIVDRVKKCRFCSVIADKVTDSANREQLSLVIRYFDPESKKVADRLLDFTACQLGVTNHAIAETILDLLQKKNILILSCCVVKDTTMLVTWLEKSKEQQLLSPPDIPCSLRLLRFSPAQFSSNEISGVNLGLPHVCKNSVHVRNSGVLSRICSNAGILLKCPEFLK